MSPQLMKSRPLGPMVRFPDRYCGGDDSIAAVAKVNLGAVVVTADRELAARVRAAGGEVVGPSWPLDRLDSW